MSAPRKRPKARVRGLARAVEVGERVFLRRPVPSDRDEFLELLARSRAFHRRWEPLPPRGKDPLGPQRFETYLQSSRSTRNERLLLCSREDGALMGSFALSDIVRGAFQSAFLGYWVGAPYAGQGYMTEGLALLLRRAFGELRLHRLEANIQPENRSSIALVQRAGFRREGLARRYLKIAGRWRDHEHWVLLSEEWRARRRARGS